MSLFCQRELFVTSLNISATAAPFCTSTVSRSMSAPAVAGQPPLPLSAEAGLAQEIDAGHVQLEVLQSFSTWSKDEKRCVSTQSKIDKKNKASRALFEYANQMKDGAAVLQQSLDTLSNDQQHSLKNAVLSSLRDDVAPLLEMAFKVIRKAATNVSSMASVSTTHNRLACHKRVAAVGC